MSLVSQSIDSFKNGVSQQPNIVRLPDQVQEQINGFSSETEGLQKRPPMVHLARLGDRLDPNLVRYHAINRDDNEQYILEMSNGNLRVWDLKGNEKKVNFPNGKAYLNVTDAFEQFRAVTVADYTFILNKSVKTRMKPDLTPNPHSNIVLFEVKGAQYGKKYLININNTSDQYPTVCVRPPSGNNVIQSKWTTTYGIALALKNGLNHSKTGYDQNPVFKSEELGHTIKDVSESGSPTAGDDTFVVYWSNRGYNSYNGAVSYGTSVIGLPIVNISSAKIATSDDFGNTNLIWCNHMSKGVAKLPSCAPDGYIAKVVGDNKSDADDYYVKYDANKNNWVETVAGGIPYKIDETTMPWGLIREANGEFTFKPLEWSDRQVGDEDSNSDPSFIGRTINDIFFYRNRLGFISDENVILSASADYFNFWFNSAAGISDDDPIDISVSSNKVSTLTNAVPYARELMLFSKEGQFVLSSDGVMTPKTAKLDQISSFDYSDDAEPLAVGQYIFYINKRVNYCSLMRYFTVQDVADLKDADDTSSHVPTYIPNGIFKLSGNTMDNLVLLSSRTSSNTLWVYKYYINGTTVIQSSWSKWIMCDEGSDVMFADYIGSSIYVILNTKEGIFLEKLSVTGNAVDFDTEPARLFIDRKVHYTVESCTYSDYNDESTISFTSIYKANRNKDDEYLIYDEDGVEYPIKRWSDNGDSFVLSGDWNGKSLFIGIKYRFSVTLSKLEMKKTTNSGATVSETEGRLQLRYFWVNFGDSGPFNIQVKSTKKKRDYVYTCTPKILGESTCILGSSRVTSNKFKVPVQDLNDDVEIVIFSDNPLPINLVSGGWEATYLRRNRGV